MQSRKKLLTIAILGAALSALSAYADEPKSGSQKPPDWSGYAKVSTVVGEIVKADDKGFTMELTQLVPGAKGKATKKKEELQFLYAEPGMARWKVLPPKLDGNGKKTPYTPEEMREFKLPPGAPGYAANRDDLKSGYIVEVELVRPKEIPPSKAAFQDLKVKYAVIVSYDSNATAGGKKPEEKEKKKDK